MAIKTAATTIAALLLATGISARGAAYAAGRAGPDAPATATRPVTATGPAGAIGPATALAAADLPSAGGRTWRAGRVWHPGFAGAAHGPVPCARTSPADTVDSVSAAYVGTSGQSDRAENDVVRSRDAAAARAAVAAWAADLHRCMSLKAFPARQGDLWLGHLAVTTLDGVTVWSWQRGARNDPSPRSVTVAFAVTRDSVCDFVAVTTDARGAAPVPPGALHGTIAAVGRRLAALP